MNDELAVARFSALAHPLRHAVFRLLVPLGEDGLAAGDIARRLDAAASTLSSHLAQLERCGLIIATRQGPRILYAISPDGVSGLISHLVSDCCGGRPELCGGAEPAPATLKEAES